MSLYMGDVYVYNMFCSYSRKTFVDSYVHIHIYIYIHIWSKTGNFFSAVQATRPSSQAPWPKWEPTPNRLFWPGLLVMEIPWNF